MKKIAVIVLIAVFFVSCLAVSAAPAAPVKDKAVELNDVSGHWAEKDIQDLVDAGLLKGKGNGKFDPNTSMTRSEFAVILHRIADINIRYITAPDITKVFDDVKNNDWYANELNDLVSVGIVDDRGHFRPSDSITREEMVHYIMNTYRYILGTDVKEDASVLKQFKDSKEIKPALLNDMCRGIGLGLIKGRGEGRIYPVDHSTRAEVAVIVKRLLSVLSGRVGVPSDPGNDTDTNVPSGVKAAASYEKLDGNFIMKLSVYNDTGSEVKITHPTGQKYDFVLYDASMNEIYKWSADMMFTQMVNYTTIEAGKSITFEEKLDIAVYNAIIARVSYLRAYLKGTSENFNIDTQGYTVQIANPSKDTVSVIPAFTQEGDNYTMSVKLTNNTASTVTIQHPTSLKYDFALYNAHGDQIYRMSDGMMALMVITQTAIEPGASVVFSQTLDASINRSIINNAVTMKAFINETGENPVFNRDGYAIRIR